MPVVSPRRSLALGLIATIALVPITAARADVPAEPARKATADKRISGWIERVMLEPRRTLTLQAKLDTGADTSSLDAQNIRGVRRGNKRFVRFSVTDPETGKSIELLRPYVRRVRIKRHDGSFQRRYVVQMTICIADVSRSVEVNLINREAFDQPLLLGRSALEGIVIVDPDRTYVNEPTCWKLNAIADTSVGRNRQSALPQ